MTAVLLRLTQNLKLEEVEEDQVEVEVVEVLLLDWVVSLQGECQNLDLLETEKPPILQPVEHHSYPQVGVPPVLPLLEREVGLMVLLNSPELLLV